MSTFFLFCPNVTSSIYFPFFLFFSSFEYYTVSECMCILMPAVCVYDRVSSCLLSMSHLSAILPNQKVHLLIRYLLLSWWEAHGLLIIDWTVKASLNRFFLGSGKMFNIPGLFNLCFFSVAFFIFLAYTQIISTWHDCTILRVFWEFVHTELI